MLAQLDPTIVGDELEVATPTIEWAGLGPLIILAAGAVLLVMFRSVLKRLPDDLEATLALAVGPLTVLGAWAARGLMAGEVPLADVRDDLGVGFYLILGAAAVAAAGIVHLLRLSFDAAFTAGIGIATVVAAWGLWDRVDTEGAFGAIGDQLGVDGFSVVFTGLIGATVVLTALLLDGYVEREGITGPEVYVLLMLSAVGGAVMGGANDLIVMFLGIETLSIAVYVLAALDLRRSESTEAGFKYFVLGAFSSAFLLYGIALVYGATGSTNLIEIQTTLADFVLAEDALLLVGFGLLLVGFGFKVAAVPFHSWTPDVYQGAPTPVTAFMASAVKAAAFAGLVRVFVTTFGAYRTDWQPVVYALAVLSLLVGAVLALVQSDVKRMLAYSSISHAGFILVGVQAASDRGTAAVVFYSVAYAFLVLGSFGVLAVASGSGDRGTSLDDLDGLGRRRPALALAFTVFLLAQAGVPFTTGFVAKFEVIAAAVDARSFWLAVVAMVSAVISAFLYLRIMLSMYVGERDDAPSIAVPRAAGVAIAVAALITIGFGLVPGPLATMARDAIQQLVAAAG